ncbi:O-antigen/teichoic acid export membrane protein [Rahnella sp. BIGb0236]|nr:O-antigen/teichoic acid export membrane protein [Rahnella sp. BIGb0236]VTQ62286.1 Lipopolysaccharide biosynthesis protein wzxC [Campylobacter jejuni]
MLVLARILGPKAFGLIGMLAIFIAIGQVFIDSGFSSALIRKVDSTQVDYSTAFYFNIFVAFVSYSVLFISAPLIATFYQQPELISLTRVIGFTLIINSFTVVPRTILTSRMDFKAQAKASISSVVISGTIALLLAWYGYGVWALVAQTLLMALCNAILITILTRWYPSFTFSRESFNYLFGFGGKLLISGLMDTAYNNLYQIVIGKKFNVVDVGQYTQANQLSSIPAMTMTNIIQRVTYPMFSHMQKDYHKLEEYYLLTMKVASLIIFPLMCGIAIISKPLLFLLLGPEWNVASNLVMALALAYMLYPVHAINLNILQVKGRSDLFLKLEVIKKILGLIIIMTTMQYSIMFMCIGLLVHSYLSLILNTYYTKKLTGLRVMRQINELFPIWCIAIFSCFIAWLFAIYATKNQISQILIMIASSAIMYVLLIFVTQNKLFKFILSVKKRDI